MKLTQENITRLDQWDEAQLSLLQDTLKKHPYSSTLAVALTKAYEVRGDVRYEDLIQRAALLSYSRKQLHSFLFEEGKRVEPAQSEEEEVLTDEVPSAEELELVGRVDEDADGTETLPSDISSDEPEITQGLDPLETQYLSEVIAAGASLELIDRLPDEEDQCTVSVEEAVRELEIVDRLGSDEEEATQKAGEVNAEEEDAQEADTVDEVEETEEIDKPEVITTPLPDRMSFSSWMGALSDNAEVVAYNDAEAQEEESASTDILNELENAQRNAESFAQAASIIDHFIEKEDDIVPKRAEFFNPSKAAKSSLIDNEAIVSETLARVYAEQGNYMKAISTYEKLSLRHPEKSSYFAALIEKLKQDKTKRS